jgi:hypothetical protein
MWRPDVRISGGLCLAMMGWGEQGSMGWRKQVSIDHRPP